MNISAISFGSIQQNKGNQRPVVNGHYNNPSREKEYDLFSYSLEPKPKKKHPILKKTAIAFLAGMATLSGVQSCNAQINKPKSMAVVPYNQDISIEELTKIKGIGKIKAIQLKAVCEFARRISTPFNYTNVTLRVPKDVANLLTDELKYEKREILKVILLNSK